jgi:PAS domain S-box-containing protein
MREPGLPFESTASDVAQVLDAVPATVLIARPQRDEQGRIDDFLVEYANAPARDVAGRTAADLVGHSFNELYPAIRSTEFFDLFVEAVEGGEPSALTSAPYRDEVNGVAVWGFFDVRATAFGDRLVVVFTDVTRQQHEERALGAARRLTGIGSWSWDARSEALWWSPEMYAIFGLEAGTRVTARLLWERTHPEDRESTRDMVAEAVGHDRPFLFEQRLIHLDGSERVALVSGGAVRDREGQILSVIGTSQDVTELRRLEAELARARAALLEQTLATERQVGHDRLVRSEARYRTLVEASSAIVASSDPELSMNEAAPSWEAYTGQTWPEYQGHGWIDALPAGDVKGLRRRWAEARDAGRAFSCEARLWHAPSQRFRHVVVHLAPVVDAEGVIIEWISTVDDVDDRRQLEEARREAELRYRTLTDADVLGIVYGEGGRIVEANDAFLELVGQQGQRIGTSGLDGDRLVPPDRVEEFRSLLARGRRTGTIAPTETEVMAADGERVPVIVGGAALSEEPFRWVGFVQDMRPQTRAAEALQRSAQLANVTAEISDLMAGPTDDTTSTLEQVSRLIAAALDSSCLVAVAAEQGDGLEPVALADASGIRSDELEAFAGVTIPAGPLPEFEAPWKGGISVASGREALDAMVHPDFRHLIDRFDLESVAFVPLASQGSVLGVVAASRSDARAFTDEERGFLRDLGDRCGLALANWRLEEVRRRAARALNAVQSITDATVDELGVDSLLDELLVRLREELGVDTVRILLTDDGQTLHGGAALGFSASDDDVPIPVGKGVAGRIAAGRGPMVFDDLSTVEIISPILRERNLTSLAGVPLRVGDTLVGVMHVGCEKRHVFDEWDLELLVRAGERIAAAIERKRLYERELVARERLEFVAAINEALVASLDRREIMRNVVRVAVPRLGDWCSISVLSDDASSSAPDIEVAHVDPAKVELAAELRDRYPIPESSPIGMPAVLRTGVPQLFSEFPYDDLERRLPGDERLDVLRELQVNSVMIVPLVARGRVIGAMQFVHAESGRSYGQDDLALAQSIASRIASALDNVRLYEKQRDIARTLQASLLPASVPRVPGATLSVRYWAAGEATEVGGDFYDVFSLPGGRLGLVIGDVCGKGPQAAAVTGLVRHTLRGAARHEGDPATVMRWVNDSIIDSRQDLFCTSIYAVLDPVHDGFDLRLAASGHPLPVVVRAGGEAHEAGSYGQPLGVFDDMKVITEQSSLLGGDTLVLYTDGITDVAPPHGLDDVEMRLLVADAVEGGVCREGRRSHPPRRAGNQATGAT